MTRPLRNYGPVSTEASTDTLDRLWNQLHKLRDGTKNVTVAADDLTAVLHDYAAFCDAVKTKS